MPPWQNALSEQERWDVTLYSYTLGYTETLLAAGESLWRERCGGCVLPAVIPPLYSDREYGSALNSEHFGGALGAAEMDAVVAYARLKSLETSDASWQDAALLGADSRSGSAWHCGRHRTGRHSDSIALWQPDGGLQCGGDSH